MKEAKKITMELGQTKNEIPKVTPEFTEKVDKWMKTLPGNPKDSELATKKKMGEVIGELNTQFDKPTESLNRLKNPALGNTFRMPEKKKVKVSLMSKAKKALKKWGMVLGLSAISLSAKGKNVDAEKAFNDSTQNKNEKIVGGMRKVKEGEVPNEYKKIGMDGEKTIYERKLKGNKEIPIAKSTPGDSKGGQEYEKKLINFLKSGISSQELADKGYGTFEGIEKIRKDNNIEYVDYVYTEPEKTPEVKIDPYAKYAVLGNPVYLPGVSGHNAGQIYYTSMQSKNIQEAGMVNTGDEKFIIRFEDPNGKSLGITLEVDAKDRNKVLNVSGSHLLPGIYESMVKPKNYELTPEEIAKGTTLK